MPSLSLLVAGLAFGHGAFAQAEAETRCAAIEDMKIEQANLLSATVVPAADDLPAYCRVLSYVRPAINFEIRLAAMGAIYNSDSPDLAPFRDAGGKLILWHGLADAIVFPGKTIDYYGKLTEASGGAEATEAFARLFMLPGVDHCGLQPGPGITQDGIDLLSALENWVEKGEAPEQILVTKTKDDQTEWTRQACPWPAKATFSGGGDWQDAQSWRCVAE